MTATLSTTSTDFSAQCAQDVAPPLVKRQPARMTFWGFRLSTGALLPRRPFGVDWGMPIQPHQLPMALRHAAFSSSEARALGVSQRRLRAADLCSPFHGARLQDSPPALGDIASRARAFAPLMSKRHAFTHVTALRLHQIDLPQSQRYNHDLHVMVVDAAHRIRRPGVRCLVVAPCGRIVQVQGLRVTDPATTFLHLARTLDLEDLIDVGDAMTRRKSPATSLEELRRAVAAAGGLKGVPRARAALEHIIEGTDSVPETRLRRLIESAGFARPTVNQRMFDGATYLGRPDLSYPALKISIEYLGDGHRTQRSVWEIDIDRSADFRSAGWTVLEVTAQTLINPAAFLRRLRAAGAPARTAGPSAQRRSPQAS